MERRCRRNSLALPTLAAKRVFPEFFLKEGPRWSPDRRALLCFCHLRWDWVFQRPQHLMTRFARNLLVCLIEEPIFDRRPEALLKFRAIAKGITVVQAVRGE
jgi:hypothetical protein